MKLGKITIRCDEDKLSNFKKWCDSGKREYQDVIREMIYASVEGRLTITPSKDQKKLLKELYK